MRFGITAVDKVLAFGERCVRVKTMLAGLGVIALADRLLTRGQLEFMLLAVALLVLACAWTFAGRALVRRTLKAGEWFVRLREWRRVFLNLLLMAVGGVLAQMPSFSFLTKGQHVAVVIVGAFLTATWLEAEHAELYFSSGKTMVQRQKIRALRYVGDFAAGLAFAVVPAVVAGAILSVAGPLLF
jgi:hypothetical protein